MCSRRSSPWDAASQARAAGTISPEEQAQLDSVAKARTSFLKKAPPGTQSGVAPPVFLAPTTAASSSVSGGATTTAIALAVARGIPGPREAPMSAAGRMLGRRHAGGGWARGVRPLLAALLLVVGAQRASAQTEVVEYYGQDALGSIRIVFDASGAAIARADYEPFGELFTVPSMPGTSELPAKQFTGQERDAEASLDYFGARFLVPRTGRFSQVDPVYAGLFDPQQWNRYAYVRNNPLTFVDPTGMNVEGPRQPTFSVVIWGCASCLEDFLTQQLLTWVGWGWGGGGSGGGNATGTEPDAGGGLGVDLTPTPPPGGDPPDKPPKPEGCSRRTRRRPRRRRRQSRMCSSCRSPSMKSHGAYRRTPAVRCFTVSARGAALWGHSVFHRQPPRVCG
jgi:RHS repeat-associated protein